MKKILMALAASAALVGFAGQDDLLVTLTVNDTLTYQGGKLVDDECVALVWTPKGETFGGFLANGQLKAGNSLVLARVNVKDGQIGTVTFQVSAAYAEKMKLAGGTYSLYLLDTRGADGKPIRVVSESGERDGIVAVNYYAKLVTADQTAGDISTTVAEPSASGTIVASGATELPIAEADLEPIIKAVKIEDGKFKVTIEKAVPYMGYGLLAGATPAKTDLKPVGEVKSGATKEVVLEYPIESGKPAVFFQATADRNQ